MGGAIPAKTRQSPKPPGFWYLLHGEDTQQAVSVTRRLRRWSTSMIHKHARTRATSAVFAWDMTS